jgi:hypothetical protein
LRTAQWYDTPEGAGRLKVELEAIEIFNRPREPALRLVGRRLGTGHLALAFGFRPIAGRADVVRGELILSSKHPHIEPVARIHEPVLVPGAHLVQGGFARGVVQETFPLAWAKKAGQRVPCMFSHQGDGHGWKPHFTVTTAVLNVEAWFLNYVVWRSTGRWPYDQRAA